MKAAELVQHASVDPRPGCGHICLYKGIRCSQSPYVLPMLDMLASTLGQVSRVIEVGTLYGGFTRMLRDHDITDGAVFTTFDIADQRVGGWPADVEFVLGNVFHQPTFQSVVNLITSPGRVVVFCDGGDKEREVREFCGHLKQGDVIMCHDYMKDISMVGTPAVHGWPGYESQWCNVKDALDKANCIPFLEEVAQQAVWGCFIKE